MIGKLPDGNSTLNDYIPFADVDFIVTDLDGTLTIGSTPVLEQIEKKILHLKNMEVFTTIATGRTYKGARKLIEDLHIIDGMPIALYNGGILIEHNRNNLIAMCTIPFYAAERILEIIGKDSAGIYIYTFDMSVQDLRALLEPCHIKETVYYTGCKRVQLDVNGTQVKPLDMGAIKNQNILSILLQKSEISEDMYDRLMDFFEMDIMIDYTDSGSGFIEVKGALHNKGIIISELKKRGRVSRYKASKILAIGDNDNDLDLLQAADISVVVANSSSAAIECADYVCVNENAEGFLDMLTVIQRARRYFV